MIDALLKVYVKQKDGAVSSRIQMSKRVQLPASPQVGWLICPDVSGIEYEIMNVMIEVVWGVLVVFLEDLLLEEDEDFGGQVKRMKEMGWK